MTENNPTTLISFLGTEPSFKNDIPTTNVKNNQVFIKKLTNDLDAVKNFEPLMSSHEEELQFISKNADFSEKLDDVVAMISDEMGLTIDGVDPNQSLENRFENKMKERKAQQQNSLSPMSKMRPF